MAKDIQVENGGYTRIHNDILEALSKARLTGQEFRLLIFLLRKTYGWNKKEDAISLSQFADGLGLKHPQKVVSILAELLSKNIIYRHKKRGLIWVYGFNKHIELWKDTSTLQGTTPQGTEGSTPQGTNKRHLKTIKNNNDVVLIPDSLNTEDFIKSWSEWVVFRKEIKKKMTPTIQEKQLKKLSEYSPGVATAMLEQSMVNGWTGLFPIKNDDIGAKYGI